MEAVIETHGLRKRFGDKLAVEALSLRVARGEVFGFLGPNGAGKTTSLKMLLGLVTPSGGHATVLGRPLGDRSVRAKIGFLPEHFRFHDWLQGRELLRVHGRLYGMRGAALDARIEELLVRVDLVDAAARPVREYSKGMLQRIGLAQALLNAPDLVFLDEPTSGLDPIGRLLVRDIIRELREQGTAVFLNSHLLGEVELTCDRAVFVKAGRVVHELPLTGAAADADTVVDLRLGAMDDRIRAVLARHGTTLDTADGALRLRVAGEAVLPALARDLVEAGAALYELRAHRRSLESWFMEVMGDDQRPG